MRVEHDALAVDLRVAHADPVREHVRGLSAPELGAVRGDDRVDAPPAQRAHLVVGERAVERTEPQREREAHLARHRARRSGTRRTARRARAARRPAATQRGLHAPPPGPRRRRRTRGRPTTPGSATPAGRARSVARAGEQRVDVELARDDRTDQRKRVDHARPRPRRRAPTGSPSTSTRAARRRVEPGERSRPRGGDRRRAAPARARSSAAVASYTSTGRSGSCGARARRGANARTRASSARRAAARPARGGANTVPLSNSATSGVAVRGVVRDRAQQPGQQRRAQDRLLGAQRVLDLDQRSSAAQPGAREIGRREQREREDLVVARADEHVGRPCAGRAGADVSPPTFSGFDGTVRAMRSSPMRRATSSTRSISRSRSGRKVGADRDAAVASRCRAA